VQPYVAERLDAPLGGGGRVFFANSGAEANECAIKLARR
jgi:acetylornithine/succinyldiaminopimelate/putrescine aminotransferase